jgi:hypothetical protein
MLPQRANPMLGLVVEPNVLERSRARVTRKPTIEDLTKYAFIDETENKLEAEYELHEGLIEEYIVPPIVDYDAKKEGIIDDLLLIPFSEFDAEKEATIPELTLISDSKFCTLQVDEEELDLVLNAMRNSVKSKSKSICIINHTCFYSLYGLFS